MEVAIVRDDERRVLLAPEVLDCGPELSARFSDAGELAADEACTADVEVLRVVPSEPLEGFSGTVLSGAWTLDATGDAIDLSVVDGWCLVVELAPR